MNGIRLPFDIKFSREDREKDRDWEVYISDRSQKPSYQERKHYPAELLESVGIPEEACSPRELVRYLERTQDERFIRHMYPFDIHIAISMNECPPISGAEKRYIPKWFFVLYLKPIDEKTVESIRYDKDLAEFLGMRVSELHTLLKQIAPNLPMELDKNQHGDEELYFMEPLTQEHLKNLVDSLNEIPKCAFHPGHFHHEKTRFHAGNYNELEKAHQNWKWGNPKKKAEEE